MNLWHWVHACGPSVSAEPRGGCVQNNGEGADPSWSGLWSFSPQGALSGMVLGSSCFTRASPPVFIVPCLLVVISELEWKLLEDRGHVLSVFISNLWVWYIVFMTWYNFSPIKNLLLDSHIQRYSIAVCPWPLFKKFPCISVISYD